MKRALALLAALALPAALAAQGAPTPGFDDSRLQTIVYDPTRPVRLVVFPNATLTLMLLRGERIERAVLSDPEAFDVRITGSNDSFNIVPRRSGSGATLVVDTDQRRYEFDLAVGEGLAAAYLVRFVGPVAPPGLPGPPVAAAANPPLEFVGEYRLSGERALRPAAIGDDGARTYLEWGEHQSLPAVFGIGPSGAEEVVDGYVRDGRFVIDRVYGELVFRIDRKRAIARRTVRLGAG